MQWELVFGFSLLDLRLPVGAVGVENQNPGMLLRACGGRWAACGGEPGFSRLGALGCRAPALPARPRLMHLQLPLSRGLLFFMSKRHEANVATC